MPPRRLARLRTSSRPPKPGYLGPGAVCLVNLAGRRWLRAFCRRTARSDLCSRGRSRVAQGLLRPRQVPCQPPVTAAEPAIAGENGLVAWCRDPAEPVPAPAPAGVKVAAENLGKLPFLRQCSGYAVALVGSEAALSKKYRTAWSAGTHKNIACRLQHGAYRCDWRCTSPAVMGPTVSQASGGTAPEPGWRQRKRPILSGGLRPPVATLAREGPKSRLPRVPIVDNGSPGDEIVQRATITLEQDTDEP